MIFSYRDNMLNLRGLLIQFTEGMSLEAFTTALATQMELTRECPKSVHITGMHQMNQMGECILCGEKPFEFQENPINERLARNDADSK